MRLQSFVTELMEEYDASGLTPSVISRIGFGNLGRCLHHVIFLAWSHSVCSHKKPLIKFPIDWLVGKHAHPVIYYITGWMLYSTIARDKRPLFLKFSKAHSIDEDISKSSKLLTSLVERRKRNLSVYCSHDYFEFVCFIESVYLANLSLKMMMTYTGGDINARIKTSIIGNQAVRDRFAALLDNQFDACKCSELMAYISERYAYMWGTFFVCHLKGNGGDKIKKLADSQATRTKVANAVVCAQKISVFCNDTDDSPEVRELRESTNQPFALHFQSTILLCPYSLLMGLFSCRF